MARAPSYTDHYWFSHDDVRLHCRRYTGPTNRPPILCIPGLTRNVRDWEPVAKRLGGKWPLITISLRGRGESGYARDPMTYVPLSYIRDIERLLEDLRIDQFILFGTSLGGLITMMMAAAHPGRVKGALINDIGPDIEQEGLDRIKNYVGRTTQWPTWLHAARAVADANAGIYPDYDMIDWLDMAKRVCRLTREGRIVYDYDPQISVPFKLPPEEAPVDGWVVLNTL
ncbi:MAG: alpha/beta hydrolase, partial [Alphaproteobacteria bacterium]|nr:alpha/beta hydrolase [Alphaproteobacteria bacterium]